MATVTATTTIKFADTLDITLLTPEQIAKFTDKDFAAFSTQQQADLTAAQVTLLTAKQIAALPLKFVEPITVTGIAPKVLSALDLKPFSADQFAELTPEQIKGLTPAQITALSTAQVDVLTPEQTAVLTSTQVAAFTDKSLKVLSEFALEGITPDAIKGLTPANITGLTTDSIKILTVEQVVALTADQIKALTPALVAAMESEDLAVLTVDAVKGFNVKAIPSLEINALTPEQLAVLTPKQMSSFTATQLSLLDETYAPVFNARVLTLLSTAQVNAISTAVVNALDPLAVKGFTVKNIKGLSTDQLAVITPEQGVNLSKSQLGSLDATKVSSLPSEVIVELKPQVLKSLPVNIIANLSAEAFAAFTDVQIAGLGSKQIAGLTTAQAASLTSEHIQKFTPTAFKNLSDASISALSASALAGLTSKQIIGLSATQLEKMTPAQVAQFAQELKDWAVTTKRYATIESAETDVTVAHGIETGGTVTATARAETITSGVGTDTVTYTGTPTAGDKISTGAGDDLITVNDAAHTIDGGTGNDTLTFDDATPTLTNVTGVERIILANTNAQSFDAGTGANNALISLTATAIANDAALTLTGSVANLPVSLTDGDLTASGYSAKLIVTASGSNAKTIVTGSGNDSITTGAGANSVDGGTGNDTIIAGAGSDTITGGAGADSITGGITGNNTFVFSSTSNGGTTAALLAAGLDTITDFKAGDVIDFGATTLYAERNALTATTSAAHISQTGKATFHASTTSLADKITAVAGGINLGTTTGTGTTGETALFTDGSDSYIFVSDNVVGVSANDVLVKLTNGAATNKGIVVTSDDITSLVGYAANYGTNNFGTLTNVVVMDTAANIATYLAVAAAGGTTTPNLTQAIVNGQIASITASDGLPITLTPALFAQSGVAALLDTGSVNISGAMSANPSAAYTTEHTALTTAGSLAKIADGGILATTTGLTLTPTEFDSLDAKLFRHASTPASSTKVTIDATTGGTTAELANISTYIQNVVDSTGITNLSIPVVAPAGDITTTVVANLLSKATAANVVISADSNVADLITYKTHIATGAGAGIGISGTRASLTATEFKELGSKFASDGTATAVTVDATQGVDAATVAAIVADIANIGALTSSGVAKITLNATQFKTIVDDAIANLADGMANVTASTGTGVGGVASTAELTAISGAITGTSKVNQITGLTLNLADVDETATTNLLGKAINAQVVATGASAAEVLTLVGTTGAVGTVGSIAANGITGSITLASAANFNTLNAKLNTSANVTVPLLDTDKTGSGNNIAALLTHLDKIDTLTGTTTVRPSELTADLVAKLASSGISVIVDAAAVSSVYPTAAALKALSDVITTHPSVITSISALTLDLTTDYAGDGHASAANNTVTSNLLSKAQSGASGAEVSVSVTGGETAAELIALSTYSGNIKTISNSSNTVTAAEFVANVASLPTGVVVDAASATADDLRGIITVLAGANASKLGSIKNLTISITAGTAATAATDVDTLLGKAQNGSASVVATWVNSATVDNLVTNVNAIRDGGITGNGLTMTAAQFGTLGAKINASVTDMTISASAATQAELASVSNFASKVALINNLNIDLGDVSITNAVAENLLSRAAMGTNAANVTVTGATSTELNSVATHIDNVKTGAQGTAGILGTLAVDQNIPAANITALFSKNAALATPIATANISGMSQAQLAAVVAADAKFATTGITGSVTGMSAAQLTSLASVTKVGAGTLTGVLAIDSGVTSGNITTLHGFYGGTSASAVITGMSAGHISALVDGDIATGGITGSVTGLADAVLNALAAHDTKIAAGSLTGDLAITTAITDETVITKLFTAYGGTTATVNTATLTAAELTAVAAGATKIQADGITNLTTANFDLSAISGTVAANLLSKAPVGVVTVTATSADAEERAALADNYTKLATGTGIDGTTDVLVFTDTQFSRIYNKLASGKTVSVDAEGATAAELTVISTNNAKVTALGLSNLTLTSTQSDTEITNLLTLAPIATRTAKIAATGMTGTQLAAASALTAHIADGGITGAMAVTATSGTDTQITALFTRYSGTTATAVVTNMTNLQIGALDNNAITSGGITGSVNGLTAAAMTALATKAVDITAGTLTASSAFTVPSAAFNTLMPKLASGISPGLITLDFGGGTDNVTLTNAQNSAVTIANAGGVETITISDASTGIATNLDIGTYVLAGLGANTITLTQAAQNVTTAASATSQIVDTGLLTSYTGTITGNVTATDILNVTTTGTNISTAVTTSVDQIQLGASVVTATLSSAQAAKITAASNAANVVTLSDAATNLTLNSAVESFVLGTFTNSVTLGVGTQNVTGTTTGNDTIKTGSLTTISGTINGTAGTDVLAIEGNATLSGTVSNIDTITVATGKTLTTTAAIATGNTITGLGTGSIAITALSSTLNANLSTVTSGSGTVTAAFGANGTFIGDLGTAVVTVAGGATFTADVAIVDGKTINGTGTVAITDLDTVVTADLSALTASSVTATFNLDATFTGNLGSAHVSVADTKTLTAAASVASGKYIAPIGTTGAVNITTTGTAVDLTNITAVTTVTATGNASITTGATAATISETTGNTATINATALSDGTLLTLSGAGNFGVTGLIGNLTSTATGTLGVTTAAGTDTTITTGAGATTIGGLATTINVVATALANNTNLNLSGSTAHVVTGLVGNLVESGSAVLTVTTANNTVDDGIAITTGSGATIINVSASATATADTIAINATSLGNGTALTINGVGAGAAGTVNISGLVGDLTLTNASTGTIGVAVADNTVDSGIAIIAGGADLNVSNVANGDTVTVTALGGNFTGTIASTTGAFNVTADATGSKTIVTAAGADTIVSTASANTITGGAGADTINVGTTTSKLVYTTTTDSIATAMDVVTAEFSAATKATIDLTATGTLTVTNTFTGGSAGVTLSSITTTAINNLLNSSTGTLTSDKFTGGGHASVAHLITTDGTSEHLMAIDVNGDGTFDATNDVVINITGSILTSVTAATFV